MTPRLVLAACLVALLSFSAPAQGQASEPPAPGDFRNGQANDFGAIAMTPYLKAVNGSVPIQATIVLDDLEAVGTAADLLFAFNVHGDGVRVTIESLSTADGRALVPVNTETLDHGRQPQVHFLPADLLAVARDGRVDLVLRGRIEPKADSQSHVGAMVIAFDGTWDTLPSGDGSAQLYGFTMVSAIGVGGGGLMPFQGRGNTWAILPFALVTFVFVLLGIMAVSALARLPPVPANVPPPATRAFVAASSHAVPVFGGPASPAFVHPAAAVAVARPILAPAAGPPVRPVSASPRQGPHLPPHPLDRTPMAMQLAPGPGPTGPTPVVAEATATLAARPPAGGAHGPASAKGGAGPVRTAAKRPKAKSAATATATKRSPSSGRRPVRRPPARARAAPQTDR